MKKKTILPVLIYAVPALALAVATAGAAPEEKPVTIEKRIEVRTGDAATIGAPMPPSAPVTFLGLEVAPVDETLAAQLKIPPEHGLVVRFVLPDSPAAAAGVQKHDVLTQLDDQLLIAPRQLSALVRSRREGDTIKLTTIRAGVETRTTARLTKRVPPPAPPGDRLHWIGESGRLHAIPSHQQFAFSTTAEGMAGTRIEEDRVFIAPPADGRPHVMIFRPKSRVVYREGDVTLEVTITEQGRQLEARGADRAILYSGPIDTPEQRAAVPADLRKHLEKLDALEPSQFTAPLPVPAPAPLPARAPAASWESAIPAGGDEILVHATISTEAASAAPDATPSAI